MNRERSTKSVLLSHVMFSSRRIFKNFLFFIREVTTLCCLCPSSAGPIGKPTKPIFSLPVSQIPSVELQLLEQSWKKHAGFLENGAFNFIGHVSSYRHSQGGIVQRLEVFKATDSRLLSIKEVTATLVCCSTTFLQLGWRHGSAWATQYICQWRHHTPQKITISRRTPEGITDHGRPASRCAWSYDHQG